MGITLLASTLSYVIRLSTRQAPCDDSDNDQPIRLDVHDHQPRGEHEQQNKQTRRIWTTNEKEDLLPVLLDNLLVPR